MRAADLAERVTGATSHGEDERPEPALRLTDVGNGQLFARQHRKYARYCYPLKMWFVCNGTSLWEPCAGNLIAQLAKASIISLYDEVPRETNDERRTKLAAHAVKSENAQRL